MSLELVNAIAAVGTLIVIAVTAVAALFQLRHMQAGNQLAGLLHTVNIWESPDFQAKVRWIREVLPSKLQDEQYVKDLRAKGTIDRISHPELAVADLWEQTGAYIKNGLVAESAFMDIAGSGVAANWTALVDVVRLRREVGGDAAYENFEYLASRAFEWEKRHPTNYPANTPKLLPRK